MWKFISLFLLKKPVYPDGKMKIMTDQEGIRNWVWESLAVGLILLLALLPRLPDLDRFVTPDEPVWLTGSSNFYYALGQRDFAATFHLEHPGVTTMWAGTLGFLWQFPEYRGTGTGMITMDNHEAVFADLDVSPLNLLAAGRTFAVLGIGLGLAASFVYARRLLGFPAALIGLSLAAFDPFYIGLSRLLHTDGLQSTLMLLSTLALLNFLFKDQRKRHLLFSGAAAGLAWLTKSPALFLIPFTGLALLLDMWYSRKSSQVLTPVRLVGRAGGLLLLWLAVAAGVFVLFWPVMWVDPWGTLYRIYDMALASANYGHITPLFFNGQTITDGYLGIEYWYFYPLTFLWRTTPAVLFGLAFCGIAAWLRLPPLNEEGPRRAVFLLLLFFFFYGLMVSLSAKKFDRYFLPGYLPLDLLAGVGWAALAEFFRSRLAASARRWVLPGLILAVVGLQAFYALPTYPYYLSYYNPLLGGSEKAPQVMLIGWGEGLDEAARYLNQKPDATELTVSVWYDVGPFSYFFEGESLYIPIVPDVEPRRLERLLSADYAVIYYHQWQRNTPQPLLDILALETPEYIVQIDGLEYARVYDLQGGSLAPDGTP
jgi:hypothetical protein